MPVVTIIVKTFSTFGNCQKIVVASRGSNIKKIGPSLSRPDPFAVNTFNFLFVVVVRHGK